MLRRSITPALLAALADRPVVLLNGARQVGKSTLVAHLPEHPARYLTLDDPIVLAAASADPTAFLADLEGPVILDEVQRAPGLFLAVKAEVDRDRRPGRFLLTGSADVFLLPRAAESLAGRMEVLTLWPLSQGEVEGRRESLIDALFRGSLPPLAGAPAGRQEIFERALRGGYPEVVSRIVPARRRAWFASYVTTILARDVRDLANIESSAALPRLLALLAARATALLNYSELSRSSGIAMSTLKRYFALLKTTFLVHTLPAWAGNLSKRLVKSPKVLFCDTGLLGYALGLDRDRLERDAQLAGPLLENFVLMELRKQASWSETQPNLYHYRTQTGQEIDLLLEDAAGRVVAVEVKAGSSVGERDVQPMLDLARQLGPRFVRGLVLHAGEAAVPFGDRIAALPFPALWQAG